ncbi:SRPBCC family protein [Aestuariibius sp. 2305UL40-4]|uniref:SRPBCC family protein n=1 Tax=Aestuariibius violaceus TaxID=3234132 RepID=UPI00345E2ED4
MAVEHQSFTIERSIRACPGHVFAAWTDPALKRRWFVDHEGPGWETLDYALDFRVGGREHGRWKMAATDVTMAGEHANETVYLDIVDGERIVYAYTMAMDGRVHSASLMSVEFEESGGGTLLRLTEQGAFFDGSDGIERRKGGWEWLLGALASALAEEVQDA